MTAPRRGITGALLALFAITACGDSDSGPGPLLKIAFTSDRDGNREIYSMNEDGSNPVNLSQNPGDDDEPSWSPANNGIAFVSDRNGNPDIWWMATDGSAPMALTQNGVLDIEPSVSRSGTLIAFASLPAPPGFQIFSMNADGSGMPSPIPSEFANSPTWSPDGSQIAYAYFREDGNTDIYVINADGTNPVRLTSDPADDLRPAWSPDSSDGSRIAFSSDRDNDQDNDPEIYTINPDGTGLTQLTDDAATNQAPAWSPDSTRIAFSSNRDGNFEIYAMGDDGSNPVRLTDDPANDLDPTWSPE